jgi:uncharacterized protein
MQVKIDAPAVSVQETGTQRGRGVFAARDFAAGELVERAPVLVLDCSHYDLPALLQKYTFSWKGLTGVHEGQALALGYGGLYNHASPASMRYAADADNQCILFVAERPIQVGEELTINYNGIGGSAYAENDRWFSAHEVAPLP